MGSETRKERWALIVGAACTVLVYGYTVWKAQERFGQAAACLGVVGLVAGLAIGAMLEDPSDDA